MTLIQFDDNLPKRFSRERKTQIAASVRANFDFIENPPVFVDTVSLPAPLFYYCPGCTNPVAAGSKCLPCVRRTAARLEDDFKLETLDALKYYGVSLMVGAVLIAVFMYFSKITN